jgi:alpha-galactosidase
MSECPVEPNSFCAIELVGRPEVLWRYILRPSGRALAIAPPAFEVDGEWRRAALREIRAQGAPVHLPFGVAEYTFAGAVADDADLQLTLVFRVACDSPVVRFRYRLASRSERALTRRSGQDRIEYLGLSVAELPAVKEVRFSEFRQTVHSFCLEEAPLTDGHFDNGLTAMGPMVVAGDGAVTALVAYEHGSQVPDAFLEFRLTPERRLGLAAVKGNYVAGERFGAAHPFETLWFQCAAVEGDETRLAAAYRRFVLDRLSSNRASRRPYVFYNTWAFQERNKWWNRKAYLDSMNEARMLAEIEVAHRMGVDVFVLDTGWYEKTGDWQVSRKRFPRGLGPLKARLDGYGMKLGLWFDPLAAAVSSQLARRHPDCLLTRAGRAPDPHPVWETEASHRMCLVSRYADAFADELIRVAREWGVTYFKWDAIHQYGCDDPNHGHGGAAATPAERADAYAFRIGLAMNRIADRLCAACPEAIVDFDITEGQRYVGLGFLASGKYFLINNGPYLHSYGIPFDRAATWSNLFVHPGPARAWICRTPLTFDKWIPSVLFLTHYLPDDPESSQLVNIGSLILGQNGIWGDLLSVSDEGVARFGGWLGRYKQVRDDITRSAMIRVGAPGGSPEIYEKIDPSTGRGAVVAFAGHAGRFDYVTRHAAHPQAACTPGVALRRDARGRAVLRFDFDGAGSRFVLFGVEDKSG